MQFIEPVGTDSDIEVGGVDRDIKFIVASDVDRESEPNEPNGGTGRTSSWTGEHRVHCGQNCPLVGDEADGVVETDSSEVW